MLRTAGLLGLTVLALAGCGKPKREPLSLGPLPDLPDSAKRKPPAPPARPVAAIPAPQARDISKAFDKDAVRDGPYPAGKDVDVRIVYTGRPLDDTTSKCMTPEDELALVVRRKGREVDRKVYCSSYGRAELSVQKDRLGAHYAILTVGVDRGTSFTKHWMVAYQVKPKLTLRKRELVYFPSPVGTGWEYDTVRIERPASGGLRYHMKLSLQGEPGEDEHLPPKTKTVVISPG
ncbi:MAG: hypothetical protein GC145_14675 [Caulobacter sp.]|nr:hypothetical protein [Caulobacter sp.]